MESIYERIYQKKRIFEEVEDEKINTQNLFLYRKLCDGGRGAVFFISAQSEFAKNKTFFNHYSKSILFVGVPYNPLTIEVDHKIKQLKLK
jgi:DNA excision repair protein ERCC-2